MVSVARIRLVSRKSPRLFKGIICDDISEIAVGTLITERPPHRSVRAQFGLPPWVCNGKTFFVTVLPYALQRVGHAYPALSPARALLARIPLGPRPSLHRLRCGQDRFVRRLPS